MGGHARSAWSGTAMLGALARGAAAIAAATLLSGCFSLAIYRLDEVQVRLRPDQDTMDVLMLGQCIDPRPMTDAPEEEEPEPPGCLMFLSDEPDFESMPRLEPSWQHAPAGTESGCATLEPVLQAQGMFVYPDGYPGLFLHTRIGLSEWLADANRSLDKALLEAAARGNLEDVPADSRERWMARARDGGDWFAVLEDGSLELRFPASAPESTIHEFLKTALSTGEVSSPAVFGGSPELRSEAGEVVLLWRPNDRGRFVLRNLDPMPNPDSELARRARKARHPVRLADVEARLGEP
jgi:hypothetical protein